ncbi:hypothetical protein SteCoe_13355 [Stentor coeruleus]|uniref:Generative cell specific-1/HAP2 domain-containing protein n=1 Tax=Stentor coeruleus TaxID=5963 RepID=A0A1R2C8I3_9CILI|nr:hypothetical protein SteCoe_13355 [Stentor coeruleus]
MFFILIFQRVFASIISSSSLQSCLDQGNSTLTCSQKLFISLSIENGQLSGAENFEATLTSISSDSNNITLIYPIKITVAKSQVKARYRLRYIQDFNNKAQELIIAKSIFDCEDGAYSNNPTCGWKYDSEHKRIWDSQGYCCKCTFEDFLGMNNDQYQRGYACKAFNLGTESATAFCLVWDDLWYSSYEIFQYDIYYTITVTITKADEFGNYTATSYTISPSTPIINTSDSIIKLIGDFHPASPPPSLESFVLFTPSKPLSHYRVLVGSPFWMLLSRDIISFDGSQCNKVGTSYTGFRGQSNKCSEPINSCFSNQLDNLHIEDIMRISNNQSPLYFASRFGNLTIVRNNDERYLEMQLSGSFATLLTFELSADSLKFFTSVSKGVIDLAEITSFESLTLDGTLFTQVSNIGSIVASFTLSILCSEGVSPISAIPLSLDSMQSKQIISKVAVINESAKNYSCDIQLLDSIGQITDSFRLYFNTSDRHTDQGTQGGEGKNPDGANSIDKKSTNLGCSDYCPDWYDLACFVSKGCWESFFTFFGIIIGIIIALIAIKIVIKRYGLCCQKCFPDKNP